MDKIRFNLDATGDVSHIRVDGGLVDNVSMDNVSKFFKEDIFPFCLVESLLIFPKNQKPSISSAESMYFLLLFKS